MRIYLTKRVVDEAPHPSATEYWISDTKIKGFGLRVSKSPSGSVSKAYCLRMKDQDGKRTRKTFDPWLARYEKFQWLQWRSDEVNSPSDITLGSLIDEARVWALDQLDLVNGRILYGDRGERRVVYSTLEDERQQQALAVQERVRSYSLEKAKSLQLLHLYSIGRGQAYIDRLDKVFSQHVPNDLKTKRAVDIAPHEFESVLSSIERISSLRMLRSFFGQILNLISKHQVRPNTFPRHLRDISTPKPTSKEPIISDAATWHSLFSFLEAENELWQQAYCLRIYFTMYPASLSRLMSARWDELEIHGFGQTDTDQYNSTFIDWKFGNDFYSRRRLRGPAVRVLLKAKSKAAELFQSSDFWFPSPSHHHRNSHIKNVNVLWERCLETLRLPTFTPKAYHQDLFRSRYWRRNIWIDRDRDQPSLTKDEYDGLVQSVGMSEDDIG